MKLISFKGKELLVSILCTINFIGLGCFQNQHLKTISIYWILQKQIEQIFLFIGFIIFGFILGVKIYNCIKHLSSLKIFLISDITFLLTITGYSIYIYEEIKKYENEQNNGSQIQLPNSKDILFLLFCQVMIGISISVNYIHTTCFLKTNSNEFSFLFIPLFLSTGIFINTIINQKYFWDPPYIYFLPCYFVQITPILIRLFSSIFLVNQEKVRIPENKNKVQVMVNIDEDNKLRVLKSYFTQYYQILFLILLTTFSGSLIVQSYFDILSTIRYQYHPNFYNGYYFIQAIRCNSCFQGYLTVVAGVNFLITIFNLLFQRYIKVKIHLCISIGIVCLGLATAAYSQSCVSLLLIQWGNKLGLGSFLYKIIPMTLPKNSMIQCFNIEFISQFVEVSIVCVLYVLKISNSPQICLNIQQIFEAYLFFNLVGLVFLLIFWQKPKVKQQKEEIQIMLVETKNNQQEQ